MGKNYARKHLFKWDPKAKENETNYDSAEGDIKHFLTAYAVDDCHTCDISNQAHPKGEGDLS